MKKRGILKSVKGQKSWLSLFMAKLSLSVLTVDIKMTPLVQEFHVILRYSPRQNPEITPLWIYLHTNWKFKQG